MNRKKARRNTLLSYETRSSIILIAQKGYTIRGIAEELDLPYTTVSRYFNKWNPENYTVIPAIHHSKREPYYETEDEYGKTPTYKWEDLSQEEINLYLKEN